MLQESWKTDHWLVRAAGYAGVAVGYIVTFAAGFAAALFINWILGI